MTSHYGFHYSQSQTEASFFPSVLHAMKGFKNIWYLFGVYTNYLVYDLDYDLFLSFLGGNGDRAFIL